MPREPYAPTVAIRDRDRKILWSRAGNCCSICRTLLVQEIGVGGPLTVIGEECHMVSPATAGPRAGDPVDDVDGFSNLLLLCPNDHRLIDTLERDYPVDRIRRIKRDHEEWVRTALQNLAGVAAITIARGQPAYLLYLGPASDVLNVASSAHESDLDYEPLTSEGDVELVGGLLQLLHDYAEMWDEFEPASRVRYSYGPLNA